MSAAIDITGHRFGRLVALSLHSSTQSGPLQRDRYWLCVCDCGNQKAISGHALRRGLTLSCGCLNCDNLKNRATHGQCDSPAYRSWGNMLQRCYNPKNTNFKDYGGRGIEVCERWQSFSNFFQDMGSRLRGYSIERIDVNGNYEPENCKWIPLIEQTKNKRMPNGYNLKRGQK